MVAEGATKWHCVAQWRVCTTCKKELLGYRYTEENRGITCQRAHTAPWSPWNWKVHFQGPWKSCNIFICPWKPLNLESGEVLMSTIRPAFCSRLASIQQTFRFRSNTLVQIRTHFVLQDGEQTSTINEAKHTYWGYGAHILQVFALLSSCLVLSFVLLPTCPFAMSCFLSLYLPPHDITLSPAFMLLFPLSSKRRTLNLYTQWSEAQLIQHRPLIT